LRWEKGMISCPAILAALSTGRQVFHFHVPLPIPFTLRKINPKLTSILFILLGLTPLLFIIVISLKKQEIRHRMEKEMESGQLQTVMVPEKEVIWMDRHEIWVNNSMFDIHSKKLENGVYTFTGLYDEEETLLVKKESESAGETNEETNMLTQLFKSLPEFCNQHKDIFTSLSLQDPYRSYIGFYYTHPFREILTPPPQVGFPYRVVETIL
jgi:hypothetical protein